MTLFGIGIHLFKKTSASFSKNGRNGKYMLAAKKRVLKRDRFTCQVSGKRGVMLHVHHLNCWAKYPLERYDDSNLITLSRKEHKAFHKWMGGTHVECTKADFKRWCKVREGDKEGDWLTNICLIAVLVGLVIFGLKFQ